MVLHGTDEVGARGIVQDRRMIPGGPVGQRLAIQFAADMSSTGVQQIVPGYRVGSKYCVFFNIKQYIRDGHQPHWQQHQVVSEFQEVVIGPI